MHFKVTAHPFKAQSDLDSLLSGMKGLLFYYEKPFPTHSVNTKLRKIPCICKIPSKKKHIKSPFC